MVGMGRFATDCVTFAYFSDVYVLPSQRGKGLSSWLIACCREIVDGMPHLRRLTLMTEPSKEAFYAREMGCWNVADEAPGLVCMTRRSFQHS